MFAPSMSLAAENAVYVKETAATGMEWAAVHSLKIVICKYLVTKIADK
jgi:hypothetical protein